MSNSSNIKKNIKAKQHKNENTAYIRKIEKDFKWVKIFFFHFLGLVVLLLGCMATPWAVVALIIYEGLILYVLMQKIRDVQTFADRLCSWACLIPTLGISVMLLRYELLYFPNIYIGVSLLGGLGVCCMISKIDKVYWSVFKCILLTIVLSISIFSQLALVNVALPPVSEEKVTFTVEEQYVSGGRGNIPHLEIELIDPHGHQLTVSVSEGYSTTNFSGKNYELTEYKSRFGMIYMDYAQNNIKDIIRGTEIIDEDYHFFYWD